MYILVAFKYPSCTKFQGTAPKWTSFVPFPEDSCSTHSSSRRTLLLERCTWKCRTGYFQTLRMRRYRGTVTKKTGPHHIGIRRFRGYIMNTCQVDVLVVRRPQTTPSAPGHHGHQTWQCVISSFEVSSRTVFTSHHFQRRYQNCRAHQHRNRERHTRRAWEGLAGMGVSPGHLSCHTWGAHRMHLRSLCNCRHSSFKWYIVGSKCFRPDQLFKVTEIKQLCYFST